MLVADQEDSQEPGRAGAAAQAGAGVRRLRAREAAHHEASREHGRRHRKGPGRPAQAMKKCVHLKQKTNAMLYWLSQKTMLARTCWVWRSGTVTLTLLLRPPHTAVSR